MAGDLLRPLEQLRVRNDLVDQADAQRFLRVERLVGQQDLHRIDVAQLLGQQAGAGTMPQPALRQQRELEARVLGAGDPDVGGRQQDVETGAGRPAVDRGDHRLPDPRIVIAHAAVDAGLLAVHRSRQRPEDALRAEILALLLGDVLARREIVARRRSTCRPCRSGWRSGSSGLPTGRSTPRRSRPMSACRAGSPWQGRSA